MSTINKVPASAGAEWLLAGFALLRKAPFALARLPILWGLASTLVVSLAALTGTVAALYLAQFVLILAGPLFFGAMIFAVREVDEGRPPLPSHLLQPLRAGHAGALIATLLPQVIAALALGVLLFVMIGTDQLEHLMDVFAKMQAITAAGGEPDPALVADLPAFRLLLWLMLVAVTFLAIKWMTFVAAPQIMFSGTDAMTAMRNSLRACAHNWTAMLVFYLLAGITIFSVTFGSLIVASLVQIFAGPTVGAILWQLILLSVLTPVLSGAMYVAWRQMLLPQSAGGTRAPTATTHFEA